MEIILENVTNKSLNIEEVLNNVNYVFENSITFVNGLSANILYDLLFQKKKPIKGYVGLNKKGYYKDVIFIHNENKFYKDSLLDEINYISKLYKLNYKGIERRIRESLKMVNLDYTYIHKSFSEMTYNEKKLVYLSIAVFINPKVIIFDYFEKTLSFKEINYIKKLIFKLNKMYNKNIIIFSNNIDIYLDIIKNIVVFNKGNIVFNGTNKEYSSTLIFFILISFGIIVSLLRTSKVFSVQSSSPYFMNH